MASLARHQSVITQWVFGNKTVRRFRELDSDQRNMSKPVLRQMTEAHGRITRYRVLLARIMLMSKRGK